MARPSLQKIKSARKIAADGVDYSPKSGALCPWCGSKSKITSTRPWDENIRIRYHRCFAKGCVLASMKISIKSIQVDSVTEKGGAVNGQNRQGKDGN